MSWLDAVIRDGLQDYYRAHGRYPPTITDLAIPFPGDGAKPEMLDNFAYSSDGTYFEVSHEVELDGEVYTHKRRAVRAETIYTQYYVNGKLRP
jgi:hypothetical protein